HQVLALGQIHAGLAADGGVDHAEQRGGDVGDGDAPVVDGRGEAGDVGDDAPAHGDDDVGAGQAPAAPRPAERLDAGQGLGLLPGAELEALLDQPLGHVEVD